MRLPHKIALAAAILGVALTGGACSTSARDRIDAPLASPVGNGPEADYPVVIGNPFDIDGVLYTPADVMNYDHVGYVLAEAASSGITAAHRTLPLPSYIEVTALDSGRTIVARVERRGPMTNDRLLALSPMAMEQLGITDGAPIRMRRVNPVEEQRAKLRAGEQAALRMDTPEGLLVVLRKRLPEAGSVSLADPRQEGVSGQAPASAPIISIDPTPETQDAPPAVTTEIASLPEPPEAPAKAAPQPQQAEDKFFVQLGAFSVRANADKLAQKVGGFVIESGRLAIVRTGPYSNRGQASDALAKLRGQGYKDAQIKSLN